MVVLEASKSLYNGKAQTPIISSNYLLLVQFGSAVTVTVGEKIS